MRLQTYRHEDKRRVLIEWIKDIPIRSIKTVHVKEKSRLGNHYHNNKDEVFYLLKGKGIVYFKSSHDSRARVSREWLFEGDCVYVPSRTIHVFELFKDSILLEAATQPYNEQDEISAEIQISE